MNDDLIRQDAVTIVARLKSGEVTPHDLLDALEKRIAAVDGAVNALPTLLLRAGAAACRPPDAEAGRRARPARRHADPDQGPGRMSRACVPRRVRRSTPTTSRRNRTFWSSVSRPKAALSTRCRTRRNSAPAPTPSTRSSARPAIPGIPRARRPAPRAGPPWRLRPAWRGSRMAPTWAAACAIPQASTASWASGRASDASRTRRSGTIEMNLGQQGPMARNVEDCALLLDAMVGEDPRDPLSLPRTGESYLAAARSGLAPKARRLVGAISASRWRTTRLRPSPARRRSDFSELGATVEEAHPDLTGLHECFITLRTYDFFMRRRCCCASIASCSSPR